MENGDQKRYWRSLKELACGPDFVHGVEAEFAESPLQIEGGPNRRGFLKAAGFTFASALVTSCGEAPVQKAMPYLAQPEGIVPGRSLYYASTCAGCTAGCGVLMKSRDGRPIKLEGNPEHPFSRGGLCAVGQASILGLYDSLRLKQPLVRGKPASWEEADRAIRRELARVRQANGAVRFLTQTITSPTKNAAIADFLKLFRDARHAIYDPLSVSALLDAHDETHGVRALPHYRFGNAEVIASFDADFLGTWISPVEFTEEYSRNRDPESRFSYHVQFESRMSLTGSKADRRVRVSQAEIPELLEQLADEIRGQSNPGTGAEIRDLAARLKNAKGRSLVISGSQDVAVQILCNEINHRLENYGSAVDLERPSYQRQGDDRELERLVAEVASGKVAALFMDGVNPAYDLPDGAAFPAYLKNVPLVVSFAGRMDETAALAHYVCPDHHPLESWSDAEAVSGTVSMSQPAVRPLGNTRPVLESLTGWAGVRKPVYEILREHWREQIFPRQKREASFEAFWERSVHDGFAAVEPHRFSPKPAHFPRRLQAVRAAAELDTYELVLYPKPGMLDGRHAYNPWLQELPDPITKITWDNYACLAPATAARLGLSEGDVVSVEVNGRKLEFPAVLQPGQHDKVVAIALGYGRKESQRFATIGPEWISARPSVGEDGLVGRNAAPFLTLEGGALRYSRAGARIKAAGRKYGLAATQSHHTLSVPRNLQPAGSETRPIVQELTLAAFLAGGAEHRPDEPERELWPPDHPSPGHRWGMAIDLTACTGCSACVIACQVENNTPVAGKDEVRRRREMHWMRIDRYYSGGPDDVEVAHQPMLCQQCEHAPCETVCPVLATVHSEEGLNQQIYNRCVGTRYCANNCPYKTRRFNWFNYVREDRLANMVLNPDVAVRSRGVMEKCTFCVQRIQEAKIEAKRTGVPLGDGDIQPACQQSCPARAIIFGDTNDPASEVSKLMRSRRRYRVLEEINVRPSVGYLKLVRNKEEAAGKTNG